MRAQILSAHLRNLAIAILCGLQFGLQPSPARADCISDCQASTYCDSSSEYWSCSSRLNDCYAGCRNNNSSASRRASGAYGAIAYDEDSAAYGLADSSPDKGSAHKSALHYCSKHGKNCHVVETFSETCAAIAQNVSGTVAWATHDNKKQVAEGALKRCNNKTDAHTCHIRLLHCYAP